MKMKIFVGVVAISILAYIAATPYITIYQMARAFENKDGEAFSEYVDFPSLRQSLKNQMDIIAGKEMAKQENKNDPFAVIGITWGSIVIKRVIDVYVTPAGITELMEEGEITTEKMMEQALKEGMIDDSLHEESPLYPLSPPPPPALPSVLDPAEPPPSPPSSLQIRPADDSDDSAQNGLFDNISMSYESFDKFLVVVKDSDEGYAKFILRRSSMGWKLTEVVLPLDKLWADYERTKER